MSRYDEFSKLMDVVFDGSRVLNKYDSIPRTYGSDMKLYMAEMHLLELINKREGITVTELADLTNRTKSAITQTVNKLEKKDLIKKIRSETYHKEINLYTTESGIYACEYHDKLDHKNYLNILKKMDDFSIEDFNRFMEFYSIITDDLKKNEFEK